MGGWVARRAGLPAVLGYLATGLIVSPFTPGYTADRHQLQLFADVGVVLLLFEVGIEIDPLKLGRERGRLLLLAPLQTVLTAVLAGVAGVLVGLSLAGAVLLGLSLALAGIGALVFGVPLALAAFISGLAITESREATEARERLLPFRDVFAVLFFVAIGALIDPGVLLKGVGWLGLLLGLLILTKLVPVYVLARFARLPGRPLQVAIGLGQIGEFSFVLATIGVAGKVIPNDLYTAILASVVLTIAASTVIVRFVRGRPSSQRA